MKVFLPRRRRGWPLLVLAALVLPAIGLGALAASLQVAPTSITVQARQNAEGLTLSNTGDAPLHAQLRVFRWTQDNGEDELEATSNVALSPPMLEIPPGGRQLVRVVRTGPPPSGAEASYRIIVDEIPQLQPPGEPPEAPSSTGLQFVLRYSIPLFLMPAGAGEPSPALRTRLTGSGQQRFIEIANHGDGHAQVADLVFVDQDDRQTVIAPGLSGYVLPGQRRTWRLPDQLETSLDGMLPNGMLSNGVFKARINGEPVERTLALDAATR